LATKSARFLGFLGGQSQGDFRNRAKCGEVYPVLSAQEGKLGRVSVFFCEVFPANSWLMLVDVDYIKNLTHGGMVSCSMGVG